MTQALTMAASGTGGGRTIARPLANLGNTCFANAGEQTAKNWLEVPE